MAGADLIAELECLLPTTSRVAAIGTRDLDDAGRLVCEQVGRWCARSGHILVSGSADGSDLAFMAAARSAGGRVVAMLPWASYNAEKIPEGCERVVFDAGRHPDWVMLAAAHHPAWDAVRRDGRPVLSRGTKALHARNTGILLGEAPDERVAVVVAVPRHDRRGGTEQGLRLAEALGIPVLLATSAKG